MEPFFYSIVLQVLKVEATNSKALFRRSKAYAASGNNEFALADCRAALAVDKENKVHSLLHAPLKLGVVLF